jgi:AraC-like DNA-binding protein
MLMNLRSIHPPPFLSGYVDNIVVLEGDGFTGLTIPLVAKGHPSIVFQLTGAGPIAGWGNKPDKLVLYGQNGRPYEFHAAGHVLLIAYFLHPHILNSFFGFSAGEVTDRCIDLGVLQPAKGMNLEQRLLETSSLKDRLDWMDRFIIKLAALSRADPNKMVVYAIDAIQKWNGLLSLSSLQSELGITERTFQRLFELHVGVSPRMFGRICQFQPAFQQINNGQFSRFSDIAYENGYADQSHFIRVFKEFTGVSPKEYVKRMPA